MSAYAVPRLIYLVIDGGADSLNDMKTSFELASTPNLDELARKSIGGLMYVVGKGVAPESDVAVFSLLGYRPDKYYVGRGPVEVYGLGFSMIPDREVALRGNLATIDPETKMILDRRCGRNISTEESKELIKDFTEIELGIHDGYAKTYVGVGYRVAVVIGSHRYELSDNISNTDPAYERFGKISHSLKDYDPYPQEAKPLDSSEKSRITAELINIYVKKVEEHLINHPLNKKREGKGLLPCNTILLRDAGMRPSHLPLFKHLHGFKMGAVVEMPVEKGIANLLALAMAEVPPPTPDKSKDYPLRVEKTISLMDMADGVYVHLKGPDEPGHDGNQEAKIKAIEMVDKYYLGHLLDKIDLNHTAFIVTCDHATPPSAKGHTDDPVPFIIYSPFRKPDGINGFSERDVFNKGSLKILENGWRLLSIAKKLIWG